MKKLTVICILVLFSVQFVSAQRADSSATASTQPTYDVYMKRHRVNNTIAWVLLTGGVAATAAGAVRASSTLISNSSRGEALIDVGLGVSVVSLIFFLEGHDNKKKRSYY